MTVSLASWASAASRSASPTLPRDPLLLGLEQVQGYGIGVGHLDELEAFGVEASDAPLGAQQPVGLVLVAHHERVQLAPDGFSIQGVEANPLGPRPLDALLDRIAGM